MTVIKKIALVSSGPVQYSRVPAALAFLAGVCEHHQVDCSIFDLNIELLNRKGRETWQQICSYTGIGTTSKMKTLLVTEKEQQILEGFFLEILKEIADSGCDAIAITVLSFQQHHWTISFLECAKKNYPGIVSIVGGPGAGTDFVLDNGDKVTFGRYLLDNDYVNYCVLGEGDILFGKFLTGEAKGMPGFNLKFSQDSWQPQIDDLDATPLPSYKQINFSNYELLKDKPTATLTASRGCVRDCTFCDIGFFWKKFRFRSGKRVAQEMYKNYTEMGIKTFFFNDSLMNGSYKQFFEFLEALKDLQTENVGFKNITYSGQLILRNKTSHSERMYKLLHETGGNFFQVGIESGSDAVRNHMRKKFSNEDIYYHFEMCEKYKIKNWMFMTVAYPTETEQDFQDTLNLMTNLQKYLINHTVVGTSVAGPLSILANSPLESMMSDLNLVRIHDGVSPFEWESNAIGGLTIAEKYARLVKFVRHVTELGYNMQSELPHRIKQFVLFFQNNPPVNLTKKTITITPV